MKAEVYPGKDGWRFRITADNGEILATGESYVRRIDAESALRMLFTNRAVDVTVLGHSTEVVEHYTIGKWRKPDTDDPSGLTEDDCSLGQANIPHQHTEETE